MCVAYVPQHDRNDDDELRNLYRESFNEIRDWKAFTSPADVLPGVCTVNTLFITLATHRHASPRLACGIVNHNHPHPSPLSLYWVQPISIKLSSTSSTFHRFSTHYPALNRIASLLSDQQQPSIHTAASHKRKSSGWLECENEKKLTGK